MKKLTLDANYKNLIWMLNSDHFYDDPNVYLRELIQNAYDACYTKQALEWSWGTEFLEMEDADRLNSVRRPYQGKIVVSYNSINGMLFVEDNGIGMNEADLMRYVSQVGASYYTSEAFKEQKLKYDPISQFGIGFISCFRVSRAILIESKKDKFINTAWNVMDRQSLEPIAAKWFAGSKEIEYIHSNRTIPGTRITVALQPKYAMNMSLQFLKDTIQKMMAYQSIPIEICFDQKKETLYTPNMGIAPAAYVAGITTLQVDNELLEGYIVIYNAKHASMIAKPELFQQSFRVMEDVSDLPIKPEWIRHMSYRLNLKRRFLDLKITRDGIAHNERLKQLREMIGQLVLGYFKNNPLGLSQYLTSGTERVISENEQEIETLQQIISIPVYLKGQEIELPIHTILQGFMGKEIRVAYISHKVFAYLQGTFSEDFKAFTQRYHLIVFEKNRNLFTQFMSPYIQHQKYVVSEIPGVVYTELDMNLHMKKSIVPFVNSYRLHPKPEVDDVIFCFPTNEQDGAFQLVLNENHRNVQILKHAIANPKVANLQEVILENIKQRILNNHTGWNKIIDFGGSFVDEWISEQAITIQSVWCLEDTFPESLNTFIQQKLTYEERLEYGVEGLVFHKDDFINWWYTPK